MWFAVAMSVFGAIQGYQAGKKQEKLGKEQAKLAEENAMFARRELEEGIRRQEAIDQRLEGKALAKAAASGARLSGSLATYLDFLGETHEEQLDWMKTAGASRIRLQLEGDKLRAKSTQIAGKTAAYQSLFSGMGSAFGYADAGGAFGTG